MKNESRQSEHKKPADLEHALKFLSGQLSPLHDQWLANAELSDKPVLFIVGCPRGGTTLLYQYLSYSGLFTYPTNFLSRFYFAPVLGARLQQMLFDFDFAGEVFPPELQLSKFESRLGKTKGPLAPHEFWYFWRRLFLFGNDQATLAEPAKIDECFQEMRAFQAIMDQPLVMKAMNLNWMIKEVADAYPKACFLFVKRDLEANALSLLRARKEFFGNEQSWYSFKPPGFEDVRDKTALEQTRWQVQQNLDAVTQGFGQIAEERTWTVELETFCNSSQLIVASICDRWDLPLPDLSALPSQFRSKGKS